MAHKYLASVLAIVCGATWAGAPVGYTQDYGRLVDAARAEGALVVYSVLSNKAAAPLVQDFMRLYPDIKVDYDGEKGSNEMDAWFRHGEAAGSGADVVWSSSMDLQMQLVKEGFAQSYHSAEAASLPSWARYRDVAYGTTFEPVAIVYNQKLVPRELVPHDHADFERLVRDPRFKGKVAAFDIEKSGVGFMFAAQDMARYNGMPALVRSLGKAGYQRSPGTGAMLTKINSGEYLIGYNVMGSYAMSRSQQDLPQLAVVMPQDYTLVLTRVSLIAAHAPHPNAARLWTDYLLSARGQKVLGDAVNLAPIRTDVDAIVSQANLARDIGGHARPIPVDLDLTQAMEPRRHAELVRSWNDTVAEGAR